MVKGGIFSFCQKKKLYIHYINICIYIMYIVCILYIFSYICIYNGYILYVYICIYIAYIYMYIYCVIVQVLDKIKAQTKKNSSLT